MKLWTMVVTGFVVGACVIARAEERAEVRVTPGDQPHQHVIDVMLIKVGQDNKTEQVNLGRITVVAGSGEGKSSSESSAVKDPGVELATDFQEVKGGVKVIMTFVKKEQGGEKGKLPSQSR